MLYIILLGELAVKEKTVQPDKRQAETPDPRREGHSKEMTDRIRDKLQCLFLIRFFALSGLLQEDEKMDFLNGRIKTIYFTVRHPRYSSPPPGSMTVSRTPTAVTAHLLILNLSAL